VEWVFDFDDLPSERVWTAAGDVQSNSDRVLVGGYWSYFDAEHDDQHVVQAFALGFDLDGEIACIGTYDEYNPEQLDGLLSWAPWIVAVDPRDEGFYLAGLVRPYFDDGGDIELLLAKVR
jgi:hypothetical protein